MNRYFLVRALRRLHLLNHLSFCQSITLNNSEFSVPLLEGLNEGLLYLKPSFKSDVLGLIHRFYPVEQFIDIGANYGQTMLEVFSLFPQIQYIGFEPNPMAYDLLDRTASLNSLKVSIFPVACSNESKPKKIYMTESSVNTAATIVPEIRPDTYQNNQGSWICTYPLDLFIEIIPFRQNFILKIDVEGSELQVLRGAQEIIRKFRPTIICEVLHADSEDVLPQSVEHKSNIQGFLKDNSYDFYQCNLLSNSDRLASLTKLDSFPTSIWKLSPKTCDFLFVPKELDRLLLD